MALLVVAQPDAEFKAWAARQRTAAREPSTAEQTRGKELFLGGTCATCHAIQGTAANGSTGPDLTHVGGRSTLAAATLDNAPALLGAWIRDPQQFKPGANMPPHALPGADLQALAAYLASLQ
jgi:cytochrome c oxidase subunit 2